MYFAGSPSANSVIAPQFAHLAFSVIYTSTFSDYCFSGYYRGIPGFFDSLDSDLRPIERCIIESSQKLIEEI
jgi:hypothetical protein